MTKHFDKYKNKHKMSKVNNNDMEKSSKSHGKKSDKETHTPMLKIFKDMIQLEKNDPEKANLLKDKERNKKRKQYSTARSKSDIINRSCDSSCSDHHRASQAIDHREYDVQCHGISKLSDKLNNMTAHKKASKRSESTESAISCALKRLATSEYTCITCLVIIFAITVIVAFCTVFRSTSCVVKPKGSGDKLVGRTIFRDFGEVGLKEGLEDKNDWDDSKLERYGELPLSDIDDSSSEVLNGGSSSQFGDLSRIIDVNKLNYGKSSERLKNFYKKLLLTDDQIKNLKKGISDSTYSNMKTPDRMKRSVKHHHFHFKNLNNKRRDDSNKRNKRYPNYTQPTGFVIEKKKIMIRLPHEKKIVPKCSHAPKDSKSHETEQKHPFYKHTQRLDELLDQFLDRNLPKIFKDFNLEAIFTTKKHDNDEHTTRKTVTTHKKEHTNVDKIGGIYKTTLPNDFFKMTKNDKSIGDVILGVTTVLSLPKKGQTKSPMERVPSIRKLMQTYEDDDENLGYEDLKEVLTDDIESHDDTEVNVDRNTRKRSYETESNPFDNSKSNPPGVQFPNWKGPLPLYPDELNTMIKERKDDANKPISKDLNQGNVMFTDVEYVEDYLSNKYEKLANMAQAYSDYGVLDEKKETKSDSTKTDNTDNRVKLSLDILRSHRNLIDSIKSGTTVSHDSEECFNIPKFLKKHLNIMSNPTKSAETAIKKKLLDAQDKFKSVKSIAGKENASKFKHDKSHLGVTSSPEKHAHEQSPKHLRMDRSVKNNSPNISSNNDVEKKSVKNIDTTSITLKDRSVFSLDEGMGDNSFSNGNNKNTNIFAVSTTPSTDSSTSIKNNENTFIRRSLKSIAESDKDKVIGIDEDITMEELTTKFIEDSNASNIISIPARNYNDALIGVDDNFELEGSTLGIKTDMNIFNISGTRHYEPDIINHVTEFNIIENATRTESTPKLHDDSRTNLGKDAHKHILDIVNIANSQNNTRTVNDGMDLSDFFRMISTWFSSLASASLDDNDDNSSTVNPIMVLKTTVSPRDVKPLDLNRSDIHYPSYDSDMIDNIGHRSRVLMSVDEPGNVTEKNEMDADADSGKDQDKRNADLQQTNSTKTPENNVLTTTIEEKYTLEEDKNLIDNKSVVKRSIGDSGLVFWSDLYDDEYGIKVDHLDKELAGKNANKGKEFMKRSKNWFQDKVKSLTDNIKGFKNEGFRNDGDKSNTYDAINRNPKLNHIVKRQAGLEKSYNEDGKVSSFAELTAKMKQIVKEAAKAVQQTRKMQVRESKDDSVANGIMQQLVRMMSELVNFQVRQKTCVKLPADLQNFLEWITNPNQDRHLSRQINLQDNRLDDTKLFERDKDIDGLMIQDKTECLETLHAVEDLIQQYDQMDDEDKSKMSGVRQYLENQLDFLNNQISMMDDFNFSNMYAHQPPARFRRHLITQKTPQLNKKNIKRRLKRRLRNLIKKIGKKHTKRPFSPDITEVTKGSKSYDKNNVLDKDIHENNNKEAMVKKLDGNPKVKDKEIKNKDLKSNTIEKKDNIESFNDKYALFNDKNDNNKEFEKVSPGNGDYRNNDEFEQYDNFFSKLNGQDSYNKDDEFQRNNKVKRNLQDVYYRALYEAKKVTTVKSIDKSDSSLRTL